MRYSLLVLFFVVAGCMPPAASVELTKHEVIASDLAMSRDSLYQRIESWLAKNTTRPKDALQYSKKETGEIVVTVMLGKHSPDALYPADLQSRLVFDVRDGRFRVQMFDVVPYTIDTKQPMPAWSNQARVHRDAQARLEELVGRIKRSIQAVDEF